MGAFYKEHLSFNPVQANFTSSQEFRFSKHVHDNVHGKIYLDRLSLKFVDTEEFHRLRDLKQHGMSHMIYPGAVHSRFEHSLGVYRFAGEAVQKLKSHEQMSLRLVDHIVDEDHIDVDSEMIKKEIIIASSEFTLPKGTREKHFLYDIVANGRNGIDVDKFDYIVRDSRACGPGCNFEFRRSDHPQLFYTRADLYRIVHTHPKEKAIELMVVDALLKANGFLGISSSIDEPFDY